MAPGPDQDLIVPPRAAISANQCRAARAWLGWSIERTAAIAGLHYATIVHLENGHHRASPTTRDKLMSAFSTAGLEIGPNSIKATALPALS